MTSHKTFSERLSVKMGRLRVLETKCSCQGLRLKVNHQNHKSRKDQRCNGRQGSPENFISANRYLLFSTPQGLPKDRLCSWHCWEAHQDKPGKETPRTCSRHKGIMNRRVQYGEESFPEGSLDPVPVPGLGSGCTGVIEPLCDFVSQD